MNKGRYAFTLIEVMVAVVIISTVIMALLTMSGNNTHLFSSFKNQIKINQYASFFISNTDYGLENEDVTLDKLVSEFDLETDLRRELKSIKVDVNYQVIEQIDMSEFEESDDEIEEKYDDSMEEEEENVNSSLIIEIGKTVLRVHDSSVSLLRIQVQ
ncbi:MAG: prepilin-type N-terminal cleavage/methylation domain-containing protein [Campylobacterota bacterium]|nr:prepilin-type N-terminal cleavage/methylation domain-containing protein [Campylobacterota bacterium]